MWTQLQTNPTPEPDYLSFCSSVTGWRGSSCPPAIFQTKTASCGTAPSPEETPWPSDLHPFTRNHTKNHVHLLTCIYTLSISDSTIREAATSSVLVCCYRKTKLFFCCIGICTARRGIHMDGTTSYPSSEDQLSYPTCHPWTLYSRSNRPCHQPTSPSTCSTVDQLDL